MLGFAKLKKRNAPEGPENTDSAAASSASPDEGLQTRLIDAMRTVYDPEIPVNIYDLGLIYALRVTSEGSVHVEMTLTAPACPVAGILPGRVEEALREVQGVTDARVELVWDPPWSPERMSEEAKLQLGLL